MNVFIYDAVIWSTLYTHIYSSHKRKLIGSGFYGFQTKLLGTWMLVALFKDPELQLLYAEVRRQRNSAADWPFWNEGELLPVDLIPFISFCYLFSLRQQERSSAEKPNSPRHPPLFPRNIVQVALKTFLKCTKVQVAYWGKAKDKDKKKKKSKKRRGCNQFLNSHTQTLDFWLSVGTCANLLWYICSASVVRLQVWWFGTWCRLWEHP